MRFPICTLSAQEKMCAVNIPGKSLPTILIPIEPHAMPGIETRGVLPLHDFPDKRAGFAPLPLRHCRLRGSARQHSKDMIFIYSQRLDRKMPPGIICQGVVNHCRQQDPIFRLQGGNEDGGQVSRRIWEGV